MAAPHILLGITGSIAAVKAPELVRLLLDRGFDVDCVLSDGAARFVSPLALSTFLGKPVVQQIFGEDAYQMPHLELAEKTSLMLIAPASAVSLAECAHGLAHDNVSLTYMALPPRVPVLFAPAMHPTMWSHQATQTNVKILTDRGDRLLGPLSGALADQSSGRGRMIEPGDMVKAVQDALKD